MEDDITATGEVDSILWLQDGRLQFPASINVPSGVLSESKARRNLFGITVPSYTQFFVHICNIKGMSSLYYISSITSQMQQVTLTKVKVSGKAHKIKAKTEADGSAVLSEC